MNYTILPGAPEQQQQQQQTGNHYSNYGAYAYAPYASQWPNDSDDELEQMRPPQQTSRWWKPWAAQPQAPAPQSGVLTLIALSDSRLRPQNTKLLIGSLLLLAIGSVCGVFFLVPRGVTVGSIQVHSSQISFNTSKSTYMIVVTAVVSVYNPNWLKVRLGGTLNVSFYDQQAGFTTLQPVDVKARAMPQVISIDMDASSVPQKYLFTIYTQCFTFPEKLIFFLTGSLQAQYLGKAFELPAIDGYFIISCNPSSGSDKHSALQWLRKSGQHLLEEVWDTGGGGNSTHGVRMVTSRNASQGAS